MKKITTKFHCISINISRTTFFSFIFLFFFYKIIQKCKLKKKIKYILYKIFVVQQWKCDYYYNYFIFPDGNDIFIPSLIQRRDSIFSLVHFQYLICHVRTWRRERSIDFFFSPLTSSFLPHVKNEKKMQKKRWGEKNKHPQNVRAYVDV